MEKLDPELNNKNHDELIRYGNTHENLGAKYVCFSDGERDLIKHGYIVLGDDD